MTAGGAPADPDDVCFASARRLVALMQAKELSAREVMAAHLARQRRVNPHVNAIVARLDDEACMTLAGAADERAVSGEMGRLHGLPWAFKDTEPAVGFPYTQGSPIFKDFHPPQDSVLVERIRRAGVVPVGKTNVPEFGMGSHSFNEVYGTTRNPYDLTKSAGGSSGGAAAALATGMLPLADGSDYGGSLRNPANFNNVVALRPTVGLVPAWPSALPLVGYVVKGPLARSISDLAFLLEVIAGADPRDPGCYRSHPSVFAAPLGRDLRGVRVAWCLIPSGLPLDRRVREVLEAQRATFESLGCIVEDAEPDLRGADAVFRTIRSWMTWHRMQGLLREHRHHIKPEAVEEIESGERITGEEVARAMAEHAVILDRMRRLHERYDFVLGAVSQVPPFDASLRWVQEIDGVPMDGYLDWMRSAYWYSVTFQPAASVPAGFTDDGLPVGIQIVGRRHDDVGVLQLAFGFEQATDFGARRPAIASDRS